VDAGSILGLSALRTSLLDHIPAAETAGADADSMSPFARWAGDGDDDLEDDDGFYEDGDSEDDDADEDDEDENGDDDDVEPWQVSASRPRR